jgi:hypothetical protein
VIFFILSKIYNVDTEADKINIDKMDVQSQALALECMKRASQLNYLDSKKVYESIVSGKKD